MKDLTLEQSKTKIDRLNKVIQEMSLSKADDAVLIAELKVIINEKESENKVLKQLIASSTVDDERGDKNNETSVTK